MYLLALAVNGRGGRYVRFIATCPLDLTLTPFFIAKCTHSATPPLIQLRPKNGAKDPTVTIKFDNASRSWKDGDYFKLRAFLKRHEVQLSQVNQ